jgi:hypothetical protein
MPTRFSSLAWPGLIAVLIVVSPVKNASAQLSLFQTESQAQRQCPNDVVVWLDFQKGRYYVQGQRLYGKGRTAVFVCKKEADKSHYRRSWFGRR